MSEAFFRIEWQGAEGEMHTAQLSLEDKAGRLTVNDTDICWVERPYQVLNAVSSINTLTTRLNYLLKPTKKDE